MRITPRELILELIDQRNYVSVSELVQHIGISRQSIYQYLRSMQKDGSIIKMGKHPEIFYSRNIQDIQNNNQQTSEDIRYSKPLEIHRGNKLLEDKAKTSDYKEMVGVASSEIIDTNFMMIDSVGNKTDGFEGFIYWCQKRGFDIKQKAKEYVSILNKIAIFRNSDGFISGMKKIKDTFSGSSLDVFLDEVFYIDFYSIEVFGKTKLGQMILYAKQGQDRKLIKEVVIEVKDKIFNLIKKNKIDAIAFVPPTVKRQVQFMKEIEKGLEIPLPKIRLSKIRGDVVVPQKTLSKLQDRIENAKQIKVFVMGETIDGQAPTYKNLLLIDDALGSGATLNEIASQIKKLHVAKRVIGLALTGSFSGFDIISEI